MTIITTKTDAEVRAAVKEIFGAKNALIRQMRGASTEDLDAIIERTEYCESGVALGGAAADQDLRRAAQAELASRMGHDD